MLNKLSAEDLVWRCPEEWLPWQSSEEIEPASTIVGQDRAVEAIAFGLDVKGLGFNVFVTGLSGTGRLTTIKRFVDQQAAGRPVADDVCFVFNFDNPEEPAPLVTRAGSGRRLRDGLDAMVRELAENLPAILGDKEFRHRAERAVADLQKRERELVEDFEKEVREAGFSLVQIQAGPVTRPEILPLVAEKPVEMEELPKLVEKGELTAEDLSRFRDDYARFSERMQELFQAVGEIRQEAQARVHKVRQEAIQPLIDVVVDRIRREVADERVEPYLEALRADLGEHLNVFASDDGDSGDGDRFLRWRANLAVDNSELKGAPVVIETEPSYSNLFGTVERSLRPSGEPVTSFLRIRAGSLLQANGGFLVLNADDLLLESRVWPSLKRALKYRRVQIQSIESMILGAAALKPQPVPLDVKVVVIGDRRIYDLLYRYDSDFAKIFKVLADFDSVMKASRSSMKDVLSVLRKVSEDEQLPPMDRGGMAAILEEAVRLGRWRRRLSSRFSDLADLLREAAHVARSRGAEQLTREHVELARAASQRRHALTEDRTHEFVSEGLIRVETRGATVGQLNGLAVYDLGHHRFGKPSRITAQVGLGREGVINIERHAGLSGPTHDKGVQILSGFLRGTFARTVPLAMTCSITFEQSYGGVDGDSASSTEVYAAVSALSGIPLRQDVAVTGSVDQYGWVQSIGGVNEKIAGFFRVCSDRELTGDQGVLIPASNVDDLHVDAAVVEAVREGRFHIWATDRVEDGIELLTGVRAGTWDDETGWEDDSVFGICQARLEEMARLMRKAGKDANDKANNSGNGESQAGC